MDVRERKLFCQVVAQLLIIDSELTDGEHAFLYDLMARHGLTESEREEVIAGVDVDSSIEGRVAGLSEDDRVALATALRQAAAADGQVSDVEQDIIDLVRGSAS